MSSKSKNSSAPYPRTRLENSYVRSVAGPTVIRTFGSAPGAYIDSSSILNGGYRGYSRVCHDVVTPGWKSLRDAGQIINNSFTSIRYDCDWGGTGPRVVWTAPTSPVWPSGSTQSASYPVIQNHINPQFLLPPYVDANGVPYVPTLSYTGLEQLRRKAKTEALGKVDSSTALGFATIGELKKTLQMLVNPLSAIAQYTQRWKLKPTGRGYKLYVSDGAGLIPAVSSQYLAYYYGLKPFVHDIELILEAYINSASQIPRQTARGQAFDTKVTQTLYNGSRTIQNSSQYNAKYTCTEEYVARSGILYEPSPMDLQKGLGYRFGDVLPAIYELTPWSFFIDYFSNLGSFINALTPRQGVKYLTAWDTMVTKVTWRAETTDTWINGSFSHVRKGIEYAERILEVRERVPTGIYANIGIVSQTGVWESKAKCAAVVALLLNNLGKHVIPSGLWKA